LALWEEGDGADICVLHGGAWKSADRPAAFILQFTPEDISTVDYFHPSVAGQNHIATLTWAMSYWPAL
jgi:hypothetical protein